MQVKRRHLLKGVLAVGATPALAATSNAGDHSNKVTGTVVQIRPGYYSVNGWVVTEQELRSLREEGLC